MIFKNVDVHFTYVFPRFHSNFIALFSCLLMKCNMTFSRSIFLAVLLCQILNSYSFYNKSNDSLIKHVETT